jgi:hypothetical protein
MMRLNFIVEGSSEEVFVKNVLTPHFSTFNIYVAVRKIQTGWNNFAGKPAKGGMVSYAKFKNDILRWVKSDKCSKHCWYTTMVDLYKFPTEGDSPYTNNLANIADRYLRVETLEKAIADDLKIKQFIPYIQLHEFETFLLINPERLQLMYPESAKKIAGLKKDIAKQPNVELINDTEQGAPSKRIIRFIPAYEGQKAQIGPLIAEDIGLETLRKRCAHFNQWLTKLENLNKPTS